jgi:ribonuclease-3 family protein
MSDYRRATGFEALMGYLYLTDQMNRMIDLIKIGLEAEDGTETDHAGK